MNAEKTQDLSNLSIVVLSHNRNVDMRANLPKLLDIAATSGCELVVVDNSSTDGSQALIAELLAGQANARYLLMSENIGVGGGRNAGWQVSTRDFVLSIDDDTRIDVGAIEILLSALRAAPLVAVVSPQILHARTGARQMWFEDAGYRPTNFHGACHLVRRSAIEVIGLNDEACTFGGEELDLSIRARAAGFEIGYVGDAVVRHNNLQRVAAEGRSRRQHWLANYARIHHKFFPPAAAYLLTFRFLVGHLVSGIRAHGLTFAPSLVSAALRGRREGRRAYHPLPASVVRFYLDPGLRPDFGNVPLWRKLFARISARQMRK